MIDLVPDKGVLVSPFNGVKVFSATMVADRQALGEKCTEWIQHKQRSVPGFELIEVLVTQSSDAAFHCIALTVFYKEPLAKQKGSHP